MNEETKVVEEVTEETVAEPTMAMVMHDENAPIITMRKLLEAGVHFGHHTRKWNPKMGKFIYGARNGIYLIDLAKSAQKIEEAYLALKKIVDENGKVLFVGIKPQVKEVIEEQALRSGSFYITNRWLGGTLTNFKTIQRRIARLRELEDKEADGSFDRLPKKEVALLRKEKEKLAKNLGGIKEMRKLPNAVVVVDPQLEHTAVEEAHKLSIPVFGIADTNADPDVLDFPIPANDDALRSVKLIMTVLADAVVESKGGITEVAYTKDEGEEVSMKDAVRQADKENRERQEAIRKARQERQERYERLQAQREAFRKSREEKKAAAKVEEKPAEEKEVKTEEAK
ncbi:MAG: 30S ribosomal protein S2 [Bacilli bacterium]|nr:30S ribosomal protein S2 [Bacilli bacterium]